MKADVSERATSNVSLNGFARRDGLDADEMIFVARKRAQGVGWQNIARMLGRSMTDVRRACDPAWPEGGAGLPTFGAVEREPEPAPKPEPSRAEPSRAEPRVRRRPIAASSPASPIAIVIHPEQRGVLMSPMSDKTAAQILRRSAGWVRAARAVL